MPWPTIDPLEIDAAPCVAASEKLIRDHMRALRRDGVLVGLSGGLDSAVVAHLCVRAVGPERVMLLHLPERDTKPRHTADAHAIAATLGVPLLVRDLTPVVESTGAYGTLPLKYLPGQFFKGVAVRLGKGMAQRLHGDHWLTDRLAAPAGSFLAKGNAYACLKHRLRMVLLYAYAETHNLLVAGCANRTELLTGTFSQWGVDQCADVMPIVHLYRSQLQPIASYLGVPADIRAKRADPDVMPGIDDKEELLGGFRVADAILWALEHGLPRNEIVTRHSEPQVQRIEQLVAAARHLSETPYSLSPCRGSPWPASPDESASQAEPQ